MTFRASAIAAPGENLFDESRIHAAFARRPRYAGSSDSGRFIIICFTSLIASSAESDASVVSKRHAATDYGVKRYRNRELFSIAFGHS